MPKFISKLADVVATVSNAGDKKELFSAVKSASGLIGFSGFNLSCEKKHPRDMVSDAMLTNWADRNLVDYDRHGWADKDPLLSYAATGPAPRRWSVSEWKNGSARAYYEYAKEKGVIGGVIVPLSGRDRIFSAMVVVSVPGYEQTEKEVHAASILAMMARARAGAIGLTQGFGLRTTTNLKSLSGTQMEILKWIANGKSTFEISVIIGKTPRAVDWHASEILRKLEVRTRAQAVAIYASA